jgi:ribosome-binding factor A
MSIRTEKVASLIKRILAKPLNDLAKSCSAGLVTLTAVRVSPDLKIAKAYVSVYGNKMTPAEFMEYLETHKGGLRYELGRELKLRATPELRFYLDDTLDQIEHIQKLIDQTKENDAPNDDIN